MSIYDEIISSISPLEIAQRYLSLKKSGRNYMAVCPFHADTKPSLSFDPERGLFYCFGCGKSGNLIHLVAEIEGISNYEALKELAGIAGVELKEKKEKKEEDALFEILEFAANEYHKKLFENEGEKARNFLNERGFKLNTLRRFKIGYAPPDGDFIIRKAREKGYNPSLLLESGLISGTGGTLRDFFRDRIIFPIYSSTDKCIAFGGRAFEGEPKYLNSPESKLFKKSKNLYGLNIAKREARRKGELILVEGYTDVLKMTEAGFENTVAPLGTAFSTEQALNIRRFADTLIILFDGDDAGKRGMKRALPFLLSTGLKVKIALLPEDEDPESFLRKYGREEMEKVLDSSKDFIDALMPERLPEDTYAQGMLLGELINYVSSIPFELERQLFIKKLSQKFMISPDYIESRIKNYTKDNFLQDVSDLMPDYSLFGTLAAFNYFKKEELVDRNIDERVFKDSLLKEITKRVLEGKAFEEVLLELSEKDRKRVMEAIFKAKEKFKNIEVEKGDILPLSAFQHLERRMERIRKSEELIKKWKKLKEEQGSTPEKWESE